MFWNNSSNPEPVEPQTFTFINGHAPPEIEELLTEAKSKPMSARSAMSIEDDMAKMSAELKEALFKKYTDKIRLEEAKSTPIGATTAKSTADDMAKLKAQISKA
jgi:UDP-galactopyranose mutase